MPQTRGLRINPPSAGDGRGNQPLCPKSLTEKNGNKKKILEIFPVIIDIGGNGCISIVKSNMLYRKENR